VFGLENKYSLSLSLIDKWTSCLEKGGQIDALYMDFEKAFDKVPHRRLVSKLASYGINNEIIKWIEAFLYKRTFNVKINGIYSDLFLVLSGVPQGSVLGPLLFVIFMNDLPKMFDQDGELFLFADDGKLFRYIKDITDSVALQMDCQYFYNWTEKWLMKLNIEKCKVISICRNDNAHKHTYGFDTGDGVFVELEHVNAIHDLGLTVDSNLSFENHISDKISKAYQMLGIINRNFRQLDKSSFILLYKSLVRSSLEYCQSIWSPSKISDIFKLEKVQKRATKMVAGCRHLSYAERLLFLQLPTLKFRRIRGDLIEVYKILSNKYDTQVMPKLCKNVSTRTRENS
jgi:ribonuclease P/MRP protein subunit RPP40